MDRHILPDGHAWKEVEPRAAGVEFHCERCGASYFLDAQDGGAGFQPGDVSCPTTQPPTTRRKRNAQETGMPKDNRSAQRRPQAERQLRAEIHALLLKQDATQVARLFAQLTGVLSKQVEAFETSAVCAAHFGRRDEQERLERWAEDCRVQQDLAHKLQAFIVQYGGLDELRGYFGHRTKPRSDNP